MKFQKLPESKAKRIFYLVLLSITGLLILILITGTIFALVRSPGSDALFKIGRDKAGEEITAQAYYSDIRIFSGLGRLRIPLVNSSVLILTIEFPYQANDIAFTEELAVKLGDLKQIASDYFSSLNEYQITFIDEEKAKTEILRLYNANLRLGRIDALYFSDMLVIDAGN